MTRRKVLGYNQALALLKEGKTMKWLGFPCFRAGIDHQTVMFSAFLKLAPLCVRSKDTLNNPIYTLNEALK